MSRSPDRSLSGFSPMHSWLSVFDEGDGMSRIYEEDQNLIAEVPLPGLDPSEIEVQFNQGVLWIKGEAKEEEKDKKKKFYRSCRRSYSYSFVLPGQIDEKTEPKAIYENGILKVSLRLAKQSESKKIRVQGKK